MKEEEFRAMENKYNSWLARHPKRDHNYKSFSHMRRSVEFAKHIANQRVLEELENMVSNFTSMATYDGSDFWKMNQRIKELKTK